jgi:cytidylate kinase
MTIPFRLLFAFYYERIVSVFMFLTLGYSTPLISSSIEKSCYSSKLELEVIREFEDQLEAGTQKQPVLILIGGFQGSGKSSLITRIKEIYDVNVISTDSIRQSLFDRGVKVSPEFSKYVSNIYSNLVKRSLTINSNILIDANSHSKRIAEMENLLKESCSHYSTIKIFLNTSEVTLRDRVKTRKPTLGCYQGTESDLEAALSSTKINLEEYDLIVNTDKLSENDVFELVNAFIFPYFELQHPATK